MSDGTALLLSWLRYGESDLDARYVPRAIEALARLDADFVTLSAASEPGEVLDILHMIASVIQTELPEEMGLTAYVMLLQPLPQHVLRAAALEILSTHSFRTMPLPAEFLRSGPAKEWAVVVSHFMPMMRSHRIRLEHRLK